MEAQTIRAHHISSAAKDVLMTRLIFDRSAMASVTGRLQKHLSGNSRNESEGRAQAWCFYFELNEMAVSAYLVLGVVFAVGFGTGAKYMYKETELALSLGTGLLAILTTIQWAVLIRMKYSAFLG
jgi:hypothetical protein